MNRPFVQGVAVTGRRRVAIVHAAVVAIVVLTLSGCQSPPDVLNVEPPSLKRDRQAKNRTLTASEVVGEGEIRIGLLTSRMAPAGETQRERDIHDGAILAAEDLGAGQISVLVENTDGGPQQMEQAARKLSAQGVKLLVVSEGSMPLATLKQSMGANPAPIVSLRSNAGDRPAGTFSFTSDGIDSATEVATYAVAVGKSRLTAVLPADIAAADKKRLLEGLAKYGIKPVSLVIAGAATLASAGPATAAKSNAVLLLSTRDTDTAAVAQLKAAGALEPDALVLGTSDWPTEAYARRELSGSLLCLFGPENESPLASGFIRVYSRPQSLNAAYGYDVVALAAGLVRAKGPTGLTKENFISPAGFLGGAGTFRLEENGAVRRTCSIFELKGGRLELTDAAPKSF